MVLFSVLVLLGTVYISPKFDTYLIHVEKAKYKQVLEVENIKVGTRFTII